MALEAWTPTASAAAPTSRDEVEATESSSVAVLPIVFEGELPEGDQRELAETIEQAFEHPELDLVTGAKVERAYAERCADEATAACLRKLGRELGVTHALAVVVRASNRDFEVEMRVVSVAGSREPSEAEVECPVCGIAEVRDRVAAQAAQLRDRVLADIQPGRVVVEGDPEGATVSVDGRRVGRLPYEGELTTGEHELRVSERGYFDELVTVNISGGATERVSVDLEVDSGARSVGARDWFRPVGWTAIGVGIAGVGAGIGLLTIHGRPHEQRCSDFSNIDANGECKWLYETIGAGAGALAVGITLANVGTTMLILDRQRTRTKSESASASRWRARADSLRVGVGLRGFVLSGQF